MPESAKKLISESLKGRVPWNKGKGVGKKPYVFKGMEKVIERMKLVNKGKFGKEHPCWKENKKRPLQKAIRQLHEYVEWRKNIFARDNFTCVMCGANGYVEADHYPVRFVDILIENEIETIEQSQKCVILWNAEGRTLCKPCHLKTLSWGKKSDEKKVMQ